MKKCSYIVLLFIVLNSFDFLFADSINGICMTEMGPTTTFTFSTELEKSQNKVVKINLDHHFGMNYAPFWSSIVTPNDLAILQNKAQQILKLNSNMSVQWRENQCQLIEDKVFYCHGHTQPIVDGDIVIEPWAIYSSKITEYSFAGKYESILVTLNFYMNNESYNISMKYQENECYFE